MPERRFYIRERYMCPECLADLTWEARSDREESVLLVHPKASYCSRSGETYKAPTVDLELLLCLTQDAKLDSSNPAQAR